MASNGNGGPGKEITLIHISLGSAPAPFDA